MAASSKLSCVCWQWMKDDFNFTPYAPDVSNKVELARSSGQSSVAVSASYTVHIGRMVQRNNSSGYERAVQRITLQLTLGNTAAYWTWAEQPSTFVPYDTEASIAIEDAFQKGQTVLDLSASTVALPYTIDFNKMEQTRHHYNTKRKIRRCPLPPSTSIQSLLATHTLATPTPMSYGIPATSTSFTSAHKSGGVSIPVHTHDSTLLTPSPHGTTPTLKSGAIASTLHTTSPYTTHKSSKVKPHPPLSTINPVSKHHTSSDSKQKLTKSSKSSKNRITLTATSGSKSGEASKNGPMASCKKRKVVTAKVRGLDDKFNGYVRGVKWIKHDKDEPCPICMNNLTEDPGFEDEDTTTPSSSLSSIPQLDVCKLRKCAHMIHRPCLLSYIKSTGTQSGFQCPTCKKSYGVKTGDMPSGTMTVHTRRHSLPGHERYNTIEIVYDFRGGTHNGRRYRANGFPRTCYLPDSPKGQKVLRLLRVAWERKLTFTIGTSVTTGATDTVVWNEIHHKTETNNYGGHGYPDPNYLDNVLLELASQGVEDGACEGGGCEGSDSEDEAFVISSGSEGEL